MVDAASVEPETAGLTDAGQPGLSVLTVFATQSSPRWEVWVGDADRVGIDAGSVVHVGQLASQQCRT